MRIKTLACAGLLTLAGAVLTAAESSALGPPAICVPIVCDGAGVKIGDGAFSTVKGYTANQALADAAATLGKSADVLTHMETIRRAVIYISADEALSNRFLAQLLARAGEAEADQAPASERALAWFDAGYFVGAASQMGTDLGWKAGVGEGLAGFGWIERAAEIAPSQTDVATIHFAAALVAHPAMHQSKRALYERHMSAAIKGAAPDSPLMRNLKIHADHWDESITALRDKP